MSDIDKAAILRQSSNVIDSLMNSGVVEPTDRQLTRVEVSDPELYAELHRRVRAVTLAHAALFGDRGINGDEARAVAGTLSTGLRRGPDDDRARRAARLIRESLISRAEADDPSTWATPLGRALVMLGAYPDAWMPRVTAQEILMVSRQRISQMITRGLLAGTHAGIQSASLARLLVPA